MFVFKAAVVGGGQSGGEIAHAIATAGIPVALQHRDRDAVDAAIATARALWQAQVDAGKLDAGTLEARAALITASSGYAGFGEVDFVIESVADRIDDKQEVFSELDELTPGHAILASDTAALSITEVADATARPDKVIGFRFARPIASMRVVEVVEGEYTTPETVQVAARFAQTIRKSPVRCGDAPGFVVQRILLSTLSEAWRAQEESGATIEEVDRALTDAKALPLGAFRVADGLGLDSLLLLSERLRDAYGDRFHVPEQLRELVDAGHLGAATGRGFYEHR